MLHYIFLILLLPHCYKSLPTGAPELACFNMTPHHDPNVPQTAPNPYLIDAVQFATNKFVVTVTPNGREAHHFKGFFLQARNDHDDQFGAFNYDVNVARSVACSTHFPNAAITHIDNGDKDLLNVTWSPPVDGFVGGVTFRVTLVQQFTTFWTGLEAKRRVDVLGVQQQPQTGVPPTSTAAGSPLTGSPAGSSPTGSPSGDASSGGSQPSGAAGAPGPTPTGSSPLFPTGDNSTSVGSNATLGTNVTAAGNATSGNATTVGNATSSGNATSNNLTLSGSANASQLERSLAENHTLLDQNHTLHDQIEHGKVSSMLHKAFDRFNSFMDSFRSMLRL